MRMQFTVRPHSVLVGQQLVEVISDDNRLLATIYPHAQGIHVVSKHITGVVQTAGLLPAPGVLVILDPTESA